MLKQYLSAEQIVELRTRLKQLAEMVRDIEFDGSNRNSRSDFLLEYRQALLELKTDFLNYGFLFASTICQFVDENISLFKEKTSSANDEKINQLVDWIFCLDEFLNTPTKESIREELILLISDKQWPSPLTETRRELIDNYLQSYCSLYSENRIETSPTKQTSREVPIVDCISDFELEDLTDFPSIDSLNDELNQNTSVDSELMKQQLPFLTETTSKITDSNESEDITLESLMDFTLDETDSIKEETEPQNKFQKFRVEIAETTTKFTDEFYNVINSDQSMETPGQSKECERLLSKLIEESKCSELTSASWFFTSIFHWANEVFSNTSPLQLTASSLNLPIEQYLTFLSDANQESLLTLLQELIENQFCGLKDCDIENAAELFCRDMAKFDNSEQHETQQTSEITREDTELRIPEDAQPTLVEMFLQEAPLHIEEMAEQIQNYSQSPDNIDALIGAQRSVHTLKGAAGTIGINGLVNLTHHFEDCLGYLVEEKQAITKEVIDFVYRVADTLADTCEYLFGNTKQTPALSDVIKSLIELSEGYNKGLSVTQLATQMQLDHQLTFELQAQDETKIDAKPEHAPDEHNPPKENDELSPELSFPNSFQDERSHVTYNSPVATEENLPQKTPASHNANSMVRVDKVDLEKILSNVGEATVLQGHLDDEYSHLKQMISTLDSLSENMQKTVYEFESYVDIQAVSDAERKHLVSTQPKGDFDPLEVNRMNELHTYLNQIIESISDIKQVEDSLKGRLNNLDGIFQKQFDLNKHMENDVLKTRMVPVKSIVPRLERCIRQVSRLLNKPVEFEISGQSINIDLDVLNMLADPLMHILRNAVDHGIEASDQRQMTNKMETGKIWLSFKQKGHSIVVTCKDDGRGIDFNKVRNKLIKNDIISSDEQLSDKALTQYLLKPGFSTRESVTATSGRGIGMDVVSQKIAEFGGYLDINSIVNQGCKISLTLPITMISQHVLIVKLDDTLYALPTNSLIQIFAPQSGEFKTIGDKINFFYGNENFQTCYLGDFLGEKSQVLSPEALADKSGVIVRTDSGAKALFVDEVLNCRDLVLKKFGRFVPEIKGIHGAATLGDGQIIAILEPTELLRSESVTSNLSFVENRPQELLSSHTNRILIVEDSLSTRRMLEQLVSDSGYDVKTAIDGIEAIQILKQWHPDVILSDLELPRLNGLELTAHVRSNHSIENTPVIMITSRYTQKHREHAEKVGVNAYLTKPFSETDVLANIEKMTMVNS